MSIKIAMAGGIQVKFLLNSAPVDEMLKQESEER
jgi:hypothetical protein